MSQTPEIERNEFGHFLEGQEALLRWLNDPANDDHEDMFEVHELIRRHESKRIVIGVEFHRSKNGYGWSLTLIVRGKHRVRWNSRKATTRMPWHLSRGADEDCNRAVTLSLWPLGMLDVWWEPRWRSIGSGTCDKCLAEIERMDYRPAATERGSDA